MFTQFLTFLTLLSLAPAVVSEAKTGCLNECGNVTIPYPFGVGGQNCYHHEQLNLECNTSFSPPLLYKDRLQVVDISLDGTMTVNLGVSYDCYDKYGESSDYAEWGTMLNEYFAFSTRNMLTAIGCDTDAVMQDSNGSIFQSGCKSVCGGVEDVIEGSCSGIGCCQIAVPKGLRTLNVSLDSLYSHNYSWTYNPCSYAFLADSQKFSFSLSDLLNFTSRTTNIDNETMYPAVLDWVVGTETCKEAKKLASYACRKNSDCVNSTNGPGYTCNCTEGYKGNPYTTNGCEDIDECAPTSPCGKISICNNVPGGYYCSCPQGYIDREEKDGKDCTERHKKLPILQLALGIGLGLLIFLAVLIWTFWGLKERKRIQRKAKFFQQNGGLLLKQHISTHGGRQESSCIFTAVELERATQNYNEILGQGGFGTVYKGILSDKREVAIKKSNIVDKNQIDQFINEFLILSQVSHPNVVKLYGCCLETEVPLLVYEYVSNGNLFQHIQRSAGYTSISWETRLRIAAETARAFSYLHCAPSMPIIHRDVKTANILLDDSFKAKVADFGISKLVQLDHTQMSTLVMGTVGYLDPEYYDTTQLTVKSDVFSFGVILVELLTGLKPICSTRPTKERSLVNYFKASLKQNCLLDLVEPQISREVDSEQIIAYSELAKRCLSSKGGERPTMQEVATELEGLRGYEMHPWIPQKYEESRSLLSEQQDMYSIELSSYTGDASSQYTMDVMPMNVHLDNQIKSNRGS